MRKRFQRYSRIIIQAAVCLLLVSCTVGSRQDEQTSVVQKIVWPKPPSQARIEFVQNIASPEDAGIEPGFLSRLLSLIVGADETRLIRPTSAVMTSDEMLYVADPGAKAVFRFDMVGKKYHVIQLEGDMPFRSPIALAISPDNRVFVSDSALNKVFVLDRESEVAVPFETEVELQQPTGLAVDQERGRLYVVNTRQHQVLAFDLEGKLLFSFGGRGAGGGQFNYPTQIWSEPSSGELWVTDSLNFRVQRFHEDGRIISTLSGVGDATGDLPRPKGVATDTLGNVYVMDALLHTMQIFSPDGELLLYLGEQGRGVGQFWLPMGIFIDSRNRIYIADSFNSRIQVFRYLDNRG